jgi:two-component system, LytTR family, response regulator
MFKVCIIDDEANSREVLELLIKENHPEVNIAATASNITDAKKIIETHKPNFIFLDIEMPGGSGFDLVNSLQEPLPEIIFCTAYGHYSIRAIECSALAYLLKPVSAEKLKQAIEKAKTKTSHLQQALQLNVLNEQLVASKKPARFLINTIEDVKVIKFEEVICCIAESNYTKIMLADGTKIVASKTLKEFENILNHPNFFRIHHSSIINLHYIKRIIKTDGCTVELPHGILLEVARTRRDQLMEKLASF